MRFCLISIVTCILLLPVKVIHLRLNRVFFKKTGRRVFSSALLTAIIVFCTALATNITVDVTLLVLVSAGLSGVAAFCQTVLGFWKNEKEG